MNLVDPSEPWDAVPGADLGAWWPRKHCSGQDGV